MNLFALDVPENQSDVDWRESRYAAARGFARSGLSKKVVAIREIGARAAKQIYMGAFPELKARLSSNNPRYSDNVFARLCADRLCSSSDHFRFVQQVGKLYFAASDSELCDFADRIADLSNHLVLSSVFPALELSGVYQSYGFDAGFMVCRRITKGRNKGQLKGGENWEARVCCPMFWRKQIRKLCNRKVEQLAREIGLTHKKAGAYVSEFTFQRFLSAQRRNQAVLEGLEATNDQGQTFGLDDLAGLGVSDPVIRRGELMVRMRGFEEWAEQDENEWQAVFVTLTVPSRFHSHTTAKNGFVIVNPKYDGSTPRDAMDWHTEHYARLRSRLDKAGIRRFGFRIVEPHHDGCPHIHAVYFLAPGRCIDFQRIISNLWQEEPEKGSDLRRVEWVVIDPERGTAAGYIAKYVSKNIDGYGVGLDDETGNYAVITAARVKAWASIWGIRQFQQEGGAPVGVWRELRRLANQPEHLPLAIERPEQLEMALEAADQGDWAGYTEAMGGAAASAAERPIKPHVVNREKAGRYGEKVQYVRGLIARGFEFPLLTRVREWTIQFKTKHVAPKLDAVRNAIRQEAAGWGSFRAPPGALLDLCQ